MRSCGRHNHWQPDIDPFYYTKHGSPEEQLAHRGIIGATAMGSSSSSPTAAPPGQTPNIIITMLQQIIDQQHEATQICG